jgi:transposase
MKNFLTSEEIEILTEAHHSCRLRKSADRIKAILLLNQGFTYFEIAKMLLLDDTTIRRYLHEFKELGIDGLLEDHYQGGEGILSEIEIRSLENHLWQHTYHTVSAICRYVSDTFGKDYSIAGMTHLLHRRGFVYKKTMVVPGKVDPGKQAFFRKFYTALKECAGPDDRIYFLDATHPQHNTKAAYGWICKGETRTIKGNSGRTRINLNGALNLADMDITILSEQTINAQAMIRLFRALEKKQKTGQITAILDNAPYNHSRKLKEFLKKHPRIEVFYLPPYSPNLNPIERLWLFFQKKILYDTYYPTFIEFQAATLSFFANIKQYDAELRTLLTDSFQTLPAENRKPV